MECSRREVMTLVTHDGRERGESIPLCSPEDAGMSSGYLSFIDQVMERSLSERMMKGMVTLVARHGKIVWLKAYGEAADGIPMRTDAIFRLASMSKTIGAAALMQLYDRGLVMPSDRLFEYIPGFSDSLVAVPRENGEVRFLPPEREITIHDLLTMTSGITAVKSLMGFHPAARYCAMRYKEAGIIDTMIPQDTTLEEICDKLAGLPIAAHPGERWDYTNLSSLVLGRIVELVSGKDLKTYLRENILDPLGMNETAFYPDKKLWRRVPGVYACKTMERLTGPDLPGTDDTRLPFTDHTGYYNIAAGLTGTACDYYKFARMLCNHGEFNGKRILSPHAVHLMTQPHTLHTGVSMYGHPWGYMMDVQTGCSTTFNYMGTGSFGWHGYWGSVYNVWPEKDLVAIFLSQVSPVELSWKTQERFLNVVAAAVR